MHGATTIVLYCLAIMAASLAGGSLPLSKRIGHLRLQVYLSFAAGAMLGAAFFHMLPEAAELAGRQFGLWAAIGVIGLYIVERFLSPHSHETPEQVQLRQKPTASCRHDHHHDHEDEENHGHSEHAAAPLVAGWSAVVGLSIHTLFGGIALGSAVLAKGTPGELGLAVFLATVLHKPADSLTISALLVKGGAQRSLAIAVQLGFSLLIPLGVALFYFGQNTVEAHLGGAFTGCVLAFSSGTFLCVALSDLLPEVQFHSHDRAKLFISMLLGAGLMWATAWAEPSHEPGGEAHGTQQVQAK
jgi:zinc and cadmium transporter